MSGARLEYRLAFDLACAALADGGMGTPRLLLVASTPAFVREAAERAGGGLEAVADGPGMASSTSPSDAPRARLGGGPSVADGRVAWSGGRHRAALWAAPRADTWGERLAEVDAALAPGGLLAVLSAGEAGQATAWLRRARATGEPGWAGSPVWVDLGRRAYVVEQSHGLGGPLSVGWAALGRLASAVGRPDLADRCEAGYRLSLGGVSPRLAAFRLTVLRKRRGG